MHCVRWPTLLERRQFDVANDYSKRLTVSILVPFCRSGLAGPSLQKWLSPSRPSASGTVLDILRQRARAQRASCPCGRRRAAVAL